MPKFLNIAIWVLIGYFIVRIFQTSRKNTKTKGLIEVIRYVDDEATFNDKIAILEDQFRDKNVEYFQKTEVLKLWGTLNHGRTGSYTSILENIQVKQLVNYDKGASVGSNEDSFFYLYLSIPNLLYGLNELDLMNELFRKLEPITEQLPSEMVVQLGLQVKKYYQRQEDLGKAFYQSILEGDYETLKYSKNMISVYKSICSSLLAKIAQDENDIVTQDTHAEEIQHFASFSVGQRFLKNLGFRLPKEKEEEKEEPTEQDMNETMVMEKLTDPEDENQK
ncbi:MULTISPECIES: hypothetical protein [Terrabacteria group]|uniref:hypothetical protein n=1 Tax=Bacillati TaxID=1783272 RepID=UPI0019395197|nr:MULTISPECIES: hypothetical protein [Terrabacteria group]MBW9212510.1 hypothetical protein [Trueperella sp. zg.1013]QRG86737.1 hypothetical protein JOS54_07825 [Bulleidia sp. zg-1006]